MSVISCRSGLVADAGELTAHRLDLDILAHAQRGVNGQALTGQLAKALVWIIFGIRRRARSLPLIPRRQTSLAAFGMNALCQNRTREGDPTENFSSGATSHANAFGRGMGKHGEQVLLLPDG
jgi:hypothetical protein